MPANSADLELLQRGQMDLSHCDFRDSNLSGLDLQRRNFSHSILWGAKLANSDLRNCYFQGVDFGRSDISFADFSGSIFNSCVIQQTIALNTKFVGSKFIGGIFTYVKFSSADFRGARLDNVSMTNEVSFDNVVADANTNFHLSKGPRALSRLPLFERYDYVEGVFLKKSFEDIDLGKNALSVVAKEIDDATRALDMLSEAKLDPLSMHGGLGHNGPPDDFPILDVDRAELREALAVTRVAASAGDVAALEVTAALEKIRTLSVKVVEWVKPRISLSADEFAKSIGKSAGEWKMWLAGWYWLSGKLDAIVATISSVF